MASLSIVLGLGMRRGMLRWFNWACVCVGFCWRVKARLVAFRWND